MKFKFDFSMDSIIWKAFLIIFTYAILVIGSPINVPPRLLYIAINILFIILLINMYRKKQKLKITKIDIMFFVIVISTILPLIFRTSLSFQESVDGLIKYLSIFELYICFKIIPKDEKRIRHFENLLIVLSVILIILGIDLMTHNFLKPVYEALDKVRIYRDPTDVKRMCSLFEYANTFAIFISITFIITLKRSFENKKTILVNLLLFFQMFAILESKSRYTLILAAVATIVYLIIQRKEIDIKKQFLRLFLIGLVAIVCDAFFAQYVQNENVNKVFLILALSFVAVIILSILYNKIKDIKINYTFVYIIILIFVALVVLDLVINTELIVFDKNHTNVKLVKTFDNVEVARNYEFKFTMDYKTKNYDDNAYVIFIYLYNDSNKVYNKQEIKLVDYSGQKVINIEASEITKRIKILFRCRNTENVEYFKIKSFELNGKQKTLEYKFLPYKLMERIKDISIDNSSLNERFTMITDSFKILQKNFLIGQGKETWRFMYEDIRSYYYSAAQMHCFPMTIWIEYGIIPLLIYIYFIYYVIQKFIIAIRTKNKKMLTAAIGLLLLIFHTILDFDLDFISIMILFFILMSLIQDDEKEYDVNLSKVTLPILITVSSISILFNACDYIARKMDKDQFEVYYSLERTDYLRTRKILSPANYTYKIEYARALKGYSDTNKNKMSQNEYDKNMDEVISNLEFVLDTEYKPKSGKEEIYSILQNCYAEKITKDPSYKEKMDKISKEF